MRLEGLPHPGCVVQEVLCPTLLRAEACQGFQLQGPQPAGPGASAPAASRARTFSASSQPAASRASSRRGRAGPAAAEGRASRRWQGKQAGGQGLQARGQGLQALRQARSRGAVGRPATRAAAQPRSQAHLLGPLLACRPSRPNSWPTPRSRPTRGRLQLLAGTKAQVTFGRLSPAPSPYPPTSFPSVIVC